MPTFEVEVTIVRWIPNTLTIEADDRETALAEAVNDAKVNGDNWFGVGSHEESIEVNQVRELP